MTTRSPRRREPPVQDLAGQFGEADATPTAKVFALLELLSERGTARLTDLAKALGVPKTTLFRITTQLEQLGYLQREPGGRQLTIAPRLAKLSTHLLAASSRLGPRHAILKALAHKLGESCSLGVRSGHEIVYLDDVTAPSPLTFNFQAGQRTPLYGTSTGKLFLSRMSEDELERYLESETMIAHTPRTIADANKLRKTVREIAKSGFASSADEFVLGVFGAAVPVLDPEGRMLAGLAVAIPAARMQFTDLPKLEPALREAAGKLAQTFD